jgi:conjugative relaxase-like TrwC/TraI family protein
MLSLNSFHMSRIDYYMDYVARGGYSCWLGTAAMRLGLSGSIDKERLRAVLEGFAPDRSFALVQNAGDEERVPANELTFSDPGTVSALQATSMAEPVRDDSRNSVAAVIEFMESEIASSRRGKGGTQRDSVKLICAAFEHVSSRANDPQVHTHVLVANAGLRPDGTWGALVGRDFYKSKMALGALYRAELAYRLQQRGFEIERKNSWFEIKGVPESVNKEFSTRRKQILKALNDRGIHSAKAAATATLATRPTKESIPLAELQQDWQQRAAKHGFDDRAVQRIMTTTLQPPPTAQQVREIVDTAIQRATENRNYFSRMDLIRYVAEESQGKGLNIQAIQKTVTGALEQHPEIVLIRSSDQQEKLYSTREILAIEERMLQRAEKSQQANKWDVRAKTMEKVIRQFPTMTQEQQAALKFITQTSGAVKVMEGWAGTGKGFLLNAAAAVWKREGYSVIGAALAGKAAQGLQADTGIESDTIHKTLDGWNRSITDSLKHHGKQVVRALRGKTTYALESRKLDAQTILVVDEANMVGTKQMENLLHHADRAGAKVVLVGDAKQLQSIEKGGAFLSLGKRLGKAELQNITRQKEDWAKTTVKQFAVGEAKPALEAYASRGLVSVLPSRDATLRAAVNDWKQAGIKHPQQNLLLAPTNLEVDVLNRLAQHTRREAGELGLKSLTVNESRFHRGDRVLFLENNRRYGVQNGLLGTIENLSLTRKTLTVRCDDQRRVEVDIARYQKLTLGYAVSVHKSEGVTVKGNQQIDGNVYAVVGGALQDRELTYVQASRAQGTTRFYVDQFEAGNDLSTLIKQMDKSNQKQLAHDVGEQQHLELALRITR